MTEINGQISMDEILRSQEPPVKVEIPAVEESIRNGEKVFTIPDDVWEKRCRFCVQKRGPENIPVPLWAVHKPQYADILPCRIMMISRPNDKPGECMSFAPHMSVWRICGSCIHNNFYADGFCMKKNHAEQHRAAWGQDYGVDARMRDYYGRHMLSVCADYTPDTFADYNFRLEEGSNEA